MAALMLRTVTTLQCMPPVPFRPSKPRAYTQCVPLKCWASVYAHAAAPAHTARVAAAVTRHSQPTPHTVLMNKHLQAEPSCARRAEHGSLGHQLRQAPSEVAAALTVSLPQVRACTCDAAQSAPDPASRVCRRYRHCCTPSAWPAAAALGQGDHVAHSLHSHAGAAREAETNVTRALGARAVPTVTHPSL